MKRTFYTSDRFRQVADTELCLLACFRASQRRLAPLELPLSQLQYHCIDSKYCLSHKRSVYTPVEYGQLIGMRMDYSQFFQMSEKNLRNTYLLEVRRILHIHMYKYA